MRDGLAVGGIDRRFPDSVGIERGLSTPSNSEECTGSLLRTRTRKEGLVELLDDVVSVTTSCSCILSCSLGVLNHGAFVTNRAKQPFHLLLCCAGCSMSSSPSLRLRQRLVQGWRSRELDRAI
jgi:hypothetical protein